MSQNPGYMRIHGYMLVLDIPWKCMCVSNHWIFGYMVDKVMLYFEKWGVSQNPGYMWINGCMLVLLYSENVCVSKINGYLDTWLVK